MPGGPRVYECEWLLNYRYGSFLLPDRPDVRAHAAEMDVSVEPVSEADTQGIFATIAAENMQRIHLSKAPKVAVYTPEYTEPWDDAVTLALTYAQIEYDKVWDREIIRGELRDYDWLHLHHEDFTGNYGKFFSSFANEPWYRRQVIESRRAGAGLSQRAGVQEGGRRRDCPVGCGREVPVRDVLCDRHAGHRACLAGR